MDLTKVLIENTSHLTPDRLKDLKRYVNTIMGSGGLQKSMDISEIKHLHLTELELSVKIVRIDFNTFCFIVCDEFKIVIEVRS